MIYAKEEMPHIASTGVDSIVSRQKEKEDTDVSSWYYFIDYSLMRDSISATLLFHCAFEESIFDAYTEAKLPSALAGK